MNPEKDPPADTTTGPASPFKSRPGLQRVWRAFSYSLAGLKAAVRHESAFRQELALGLPMVLLALWLAPGRWQLLALVGSVVLVWIVELLNSAIEALADAVTLNRHPLLGRAKDLGSAAVMLSLVFAGVVWVVVLWP
ncbi:MAG: diacylglycerol kinase [Rubrivivax sp.]|nr:diacylglycerol kinase [Rubrivivax sp.]MDP3225035.1 diacylglycerol kinase [Rubrivivax sp.]